MAQRESAHRRICSCRTTGSPLHAAAAAAAAAAAVMTSIIEASDNVPGGMSQWNDSAIISPALARRARRRHGHSPFAPPTADFFPWLELWLDLGLGKAKG